MASIKGIEIKNVKTFRGHEYPTNYQGNIYFNGVKKGFWSQDGWGVDLINMNLILRNLMQ